MLGRVHGLVHSREFSTSVTCHSALHSTSIIAAPWNVCCAQIPLELGPLAKS